MDVRRLQVLRELADRGSVGATADALHITSSAVSQQLKTLEREAGHRLVEPAGRGVALTAAGRALARTAEEIAVAIAGAEGRWHEFMQSPGGEVRLATFQTGGEMLLPGLLTCMADVPEVELSVFDVVGNVVDFAELVPDHDVVIADSPTSSTTWIGGSIDVVPLMSEPLDVALPADHPLADRSSLSPRDVVGERWIGVPEGFPFDRVLGQVVASTGESVDVVLRIADNGIVESLVAAGHGIAILPRYTTRDRGNGLVTRPLTGIRAARDISALVRPDRHERPSVKLVLDALRAEAKAVQATHRSARPQST